MDRNQFTGLILLLVLMTVYFTFFAPDPPEEQPEQVDPQELVQETLPEQEEVQPSQPALSDSAANKLNELKYGIFSTAAQGEVRIHSIENDKMVVDFSSKGGTINQVILKEYESYDGSPLIIKAPERSKINLYVNHLSRQVNLADLFYSVQRKNFTDSTQLVFTLNVAGNEELKQIYTLRNGSFKIGYSLQSNGFEKLIDPSDLTFYWTNLASRLERDVKDARIRTTVRYYAKDGDVDYLSARADGHEEENVEKAVGWVAFKQKFFTTAIIAENQFQNAFITADIAADEESTKLLTMQMQVPYTDLAKGSVNFDYFFGPNDFKLLKSTAPEFDENINLGWSILSIVNIYLIIPIFNFLELFIPNYGLIIIVMVIIIRIILSPLTYKSHISMAKMKVLKPELDEIKEKHDGDMQKAQQEQMDLYRKVGINPLSGCIPILLQFPILVALFYFIPAAIEFRLTPFLWSSDLSTYDSILKLPFTIPFYGSHVSLFTLLMAGSTVLYTWANSQSTTVQGPMKTMQYIMPVMLLFFFNSYPSGLSYYYFISNLVSFGQIALFRKLINDEKLKAILEENKKRNANKKKSRFQMKLEDALKASQEAQKKSKKK